jgi:hypothetical protein
MPKMRTAAFYCVLFAVDTVLYTAYMRWIRHTCGGYGIHAVDNFIYVFFNFTHRISTVFITKKMKKIRK